jgi:AraC-like DNA-binding protein
MWGDRVDGDTLMLVGTYPTPGEIGRPLLAALPPLVVLQRDDRYSRLVSLLGEEIARDAPGQDAVVDRVLDLLLIAALRAWLTSPDGRAPGWYRGRADPVVGRALELIHDHPAQPWTVARLAARSGASRATLARRFTGLVGQPPMAYLTSWRLALAADLLCDPVNTIGSVARQVGYGSGFAFSAAFTRVRGVSPSRHRRAAPARGTRA